MNEGSSNREMEKLHPESNDMNNKSYYLRFCASQDSAPGLGPVIGMS
jgi:hypothetical protein